jgi:hypothetical protein
MPRVEVKLSELFTFEAITRALEPPQESPAGMGVIFGKKIIKTTGTLSVFEQATG